MFLLTVESLSGEAERERRRRDESERHFEHLKGMSDFYIGN